MQGIRVLGTAIATIAVLALPFLGGALGSSAPAQATAASGVAASAASCPGALSGLAADPVGNTTSPLGVGGTRQDDLVLFASAYNAIRISHCLEPIPFENFTWSSCMEQRLFWMAEDPSTDPLSAWGHLGSVRSDGKPSVGCDGNLAGGPDNLGTTVAGKWWDSLPHRLSLFRPESSIEGACIAFAMTHGGVPNENPDFTRAAARWYDC